jgi:hypothetical protein
MTYWQRWRRKPETAWLRKATFQVHLWSGIGLGLYVLLVVMALRKVAAVAEDHSNQSCSTG